MKTSTVNSLIMARSLHDEAMKLIDSDDRHMCSAGLIVLQDALEIIFLALLTEMGVDEKKSLDSKGFDELVGELRKAGLQVPKSGTLKALNKQRVITKHYGQLADPITVRTYAEAAEVAVAELTQQVLGRNLREVFLADLLDPDSEAKPFLEEAARLIGRGDWLSALIEVRKALFVEIEHEYAIHNWGKVDPANSLGGFLAFGLSGPGGNKAPYWTRNRKWIDEKVKEPLDYVQIDHQQLRLDAMEWGVNTAELENLRRLTPAVFRGEKDGSWHIKYDMEFPPNEATPLNASYCLDRAISILLRKQQHARTKRWPRREEAFNPPTIYLGASVYARASTASEVVHQVQSEYRYQFHKIVTGFDPNESFYEIGGYREDPGSALGRSSWISGYLMVQEKNGE